MKTKKKKFLLWALALMMLVGTVGCARPAETPTLPAVPGIDLHDCQLSSPGMSFTIKAHCGTLAVYEDQVSKTGRMIDLHIAVIKAVSKTPLPDAIFLLAGGPGQAATETFPAMVGILDRLHQKRDIVLVDQRGTGQSAPLKCPDLEGATGDELDPGEAQARAIQILSDCAARLEADPRHYTTPAFVEDLEEVRTALGYGPANLVGISYGTRVALAYANRYPESVRTLTLDGVAPPDWELGPDNPANAQNVLELVFKRCEADPGCREAFPDLRSEFAQVIDGLETPREVSFPDPVSGEPFKMKLNRDAAAMTLQILLYTPETASLLPLLIHETVKREDYGLLAAQYRIAAGGLSQSISNGLYLSVLCAEDAPFYPRTASPVESFLRDRTGDLVEQCAAWPHAKADLEFKQGVVSDIPALLLSGEADPVTPPENAGLAARGLNNSLSLTVPGTGHNVIFRGCVPKVVTSFIDQGAPDMLDTGCLEEIQPTPFLLNFSGWNP